MRKLHALDILEDKREMRKSLVGPWTWLHLANCLAFLLWKSSSCCPAGKNSNPLFAAKSFPTAVHEQPQAFRRRPATPPSIASDSYDWKAEMTWDGTSRVNPVYVTMGQWIVFMYSLLHENLWRYLKLMTPSGLTPLEGLETSCQAIDASGPQKAKGDCHLATPDITLNQEDLQPTHWRHIAAFIFTHELHTNLLNERF